MRPLILTTSLALASLLLASPSLASVDTEQCDLLAAAPLDDLRPSHIPGVALEDIEVDAAEPSCRAAWLETNDPRYAFQLGRVLDMAGDNDGALAAYEAAVNGGYNAARVNLGLLVERIALLRTAALDQAAADEGNVVALYNLAIDFRDGRGVEEDAEQAVALFTEAAERGYAWAAYDLALMYDEGQMVLENDQLAVQFYEQAVEGGNEWAMFNLAIMYRDGDGVEVDLARAAELFRLAYERGDINAGMNLGLLLQDGSEAERSESQALLVEALNARDLELGTLLIEPAGELGEASTRALEEVLSQAGALVGTPDGVLDQSTAEAVRAFYAQGA